MVFTMEDAPEEIYFESESRPFHEIINSAHHPAVLQYDVSQQEIDPRLVATDFDPSKPIKLLSTQTVHRVYGRSAKFNPNTNCFQDDGVDVTVDDQYKGWFAVFGNPDAVFNDPVVPHFRNVGKLAISPCFTFLVSGNQPLEAMKVLRHDNGSKSLKPFQVAPGSVLSKKGMYTVSLKIKVKKSVFKKKVIKKDEMYLGCRDEENNEMLISCQTQGIFYVLCQISGQVKAPIVQMEDIVNRYTFPLLVKLVHGNTTNQTPPTCKGTFVLLKSEHIKTSLASTLFTSQPTFFEISGDTSMRFFASSHISHTYANDESSGIYQNFLTDVDDDAPRSHNIRFRCCDVALTSDERSSSNFGNGSGLSNEDGGRFDWSNVAAASPNAPFLEVVDNPDDARVLFTHHELGPTSPQLQTQLSRGRNKKTKVETKAIKRTTMYETPINLNLESIPISIRRQSSADSTDSTGSNAAPTDHLRESQYENCSSSASSSTAGSVIDTGKSDNVYGQVWSDTSSDISGESVEFVVENVTITGVTTRDLQEFRLGPSEEGPLEEEEDKEEEGGGATGLLRPSASDWLENENPYDFLCHEHTRNSTHNYLQMGQMMDDGLHILASPDASWEPGANDQTLPLRNIQTYDDPTDGSYQYPGYINCQPLNKDTNETDQTTNYGTYEKPRTRSYISVLPNNYDSPDNLFTPTSPENTFTAPRQEEEDDDPYEIVDNIYESLIVPDGSVPSTSCSQETSGQYVSASTLERDTKLRTLTGNENNPNQCLYMNTPSVTQPKNDSLLDKLIENVKNLGIKPATEDVIRNIDPQTFENCRDSDSELRDSLNKVLSGVSRIDFNKISLFLDGNMKS